MTQGAARGVLSLGLAQALGLAAALGAASLYARWMPPAAFAQWGLALAAARAAQLLLDGGLKTALVRRAQWPDRAALQRLVRLSGQGALGGTALAAALAWTGLATGRLDTAAALLLLIYPAAYLLSYPPMFTALARLERAGSFAPVGRAEGASVALEFVLPAMAMAAGLPWWLAFGLAAVAARALRVLWLRKAAPADGDADEAGAGSARDLAREGAGMQAVAALAMLRDQMHLWLLVPWFGAAWGGLYTFAGTACALVSQVGVQTAARVGLSALRAAAPAARWAAVQRQMRLLAIATLPPLALLPAWLAWADAAAWGGRWHDAVLLVPALVLRMVAGVGTTGLGAWLMVELSPWRVARVHAAWTAGEILLAALALALFGPAGLALALALGVWLGLALFLRALTPPPARRERARALLAMLCLRPSMAGAVALGLWAWRDPSVLPLATALLLGCWWSEAPVRHWAGGLRLARRAGAAG